MEAMLKAWAHSMTSLRTGEKHANFKHYVFTEIVVKSNCRARKRAVELEMLRLCIIESYVGGLTELNETFEINLTAGKLFMTICVHKLTCYLVLLVLSFCALDTNPR